MSNLKLTVLKNSCNDSWIALTYSEYLMHCAKVKTDFMDSITTINNDPDLEQLVDVSESKLSGYFAEADKIIYDIVAGPDVDPSTFSRDDFWYQQNWTVLYGEYSSYYNDIIIPIYTQLGFTSENYPSATDFYNEYVKKNTISQMVIKGPAYQSLLENKVSEQLTLLGYDSNTTYTLNDGFVNMKQLIKSIVTETEVSSTTGAIKLAATDSLDNVINDVEFTLDEFWDEAKSNLVSAIAWAQGFAAASIDNMSDRIQSFTANISTMVNDAGAKFATTISTVKAMLAQQSHSVSGFIDSAEEMLGWNQLTNQSSETISKTDVCAYTGASPLSDLNLNTAKGVLTATGRTIVAAGKAIWSGMKKLGKKIWGKVRPYVMAITNNPYDIQEINQDSLSYTIDGWCYTIKSALMYDDSGLSQSTIDSYINAASKHLNEWIKISTIFGEVLYRITNIADNMSWVDIGVSHSGLLVEYEMQIKPRCMNWRTIKQYCSPNQAGSFRIFPATYDSGTGRYDLEEYSQLLLDFKQSNDLYYSVDKTEGDLLCGFLSGMASLNSLFSMSWYDIMYDLDDSSIERLQYFCPYERKRYSGNISLDTMYASDSFFEPDNSTITNADFLKAVSGWNGQTNPDLTNFWTYYGLTSNNTVTPVYPNFGDNTLPPIPCQFAPCVITSMLEIWRDKYLNPMDFAYYPYSSNSTDFDPPKFKIKTDAENKDIANTFYNVLALVVLVAISVIVVGSIVKIAKTKAIGRKQWSIAQMDQRMWNGQRLSLYDQLRYQRKTRKLAKLTSATSGLSAGTGVVESVSKLSQGVSNIYSNLNTTGAFGFTGSGTPTELTADINSWDSYSSIMKAITGMDYNLHWN